MATSILSPSQPISDLNMTPLIDVLLVLIVMFIVTVPLQTHAVRVDLPASVAHPPIQPDPVHNRITIDARGGIGWNGVPVDRAGLRALLAQSMRLSLEPALDLKPAAEARYEIVDAVMADIKHAGVTKLGMTDLAAYRAF